MGVHRKTSQMVRALGLAIVSCGFAGLAIADEAAEKSSSDWFSGPFYIGVAPQFATTTFTTTLTSAMGTVQSGEFDSRPPAVNVRGGWYLLPWLPVEVQWAFPVDQDKVSGTGSEDFGDAELNSHLSLSIKPELKLSLLNRVPDFQHLQLSDTLALYGVVGWNDLEIQVDDGANNRFKFSESGLMLGAGIRLGSEEASLMIEYVEFVDSGSLQADGLIVGINGYF